MPEITETTPREDYTIAGETFSFAQPYTEGHVLTAGEASQLNQVFAENVRNNFAKKVSDAKEKGAFEHDVFQGQLDDYMASYEMGVRVGGARIGDPVEAEAMNIARDQVRKALAKKGHKVSDISAKQITELARGVLARGDAKADQIRSIAKTRVEASKEIEDIDVGEITPTETGAGEEAEAAPASKSKRGAAAPEEAPTA